ncbi:MAG: ATP-dependent DNA helicase RecG [Cryomorphaceae bacterium]
MNALLQTPLHYISGIGEQRAALLAEEFGMRTVEDLFTHYPFRYVDRSEVKQIGMLREGPDYVQVRGVLGPVREEGTGRAKRLRSSIADDTGRIELIWFKGISYIAPQLLTGAEYVAFGKVGSYKGRYNMAHPELERITPGTEVDGYMQPVYSTTEKLTKRGLSSTGFEKIITRLLKQAEGQVRETLPAYLLESLKLPGKADALTAIHNPRSEEDVKQARRRLKFEELFYVQLELLMKKELRNSRTAGFVFENVAEAFRSFYENHLPFDLTGAQKRVLKEIRRDLRAGYQMNRLLQGDVGSGKTVVAALSALIAIDNGYQVSIMAPTEILANQHFETFSEYFKDMPLKVALLTGSVKAKRRREIDEICRSGELNVLIGTHALLEDRVVFNNIGLAIIDEQHRFGVAQRAKLW